MPIGKIGEEEHFYYSLPVCQTLSRLLKDDSVRSYILHAPIFCEDPIIYRSFRDGSIIRSMAISGPYILLTVYLDAFATNNPLGSSREKDKGGHYVL